MLSQKRAPSKAKPTKPPKRKVTFSADTEKPPVKSADKLICADQAIITAFISQTFSTLPVLNDALAELKRSARLVVLSDQSIATLLQTHLQQWATDTELDLQPPLEHLVKFAELCHEHEAGLNAFKTLFQTAQTWPIATLAEFFRVLFSTKDSLFAEIYPPAQTSQASQDHPQYGLSSWLDRHKSRSAQCAFHLIARALKPQLRELYEPVMQFLEHCLHKGTHFKEEEREIAESLFFSALEPFYLVANYFRSERFPDRNQRYRNLLLHYSGIIYSAYSYANDTEASLLGTHGNFLRIISWLFPEPQQRTLLFIHLLQTTDLNASEPFYRFCINHLGANQFKHRLFNGGQLKDRASLKASVQQILTQHGAKNMVACAGLMKQVPLSAAVHIAQQKSAMETANQKPKRQTASQVALTATNRAANRAAAAAAYRALTPSTDDTKKTRQIGLGPKG